MLRQLTIKSRSPDELRLLAVERRQLASTKTGRVQKLLFNEAKLLDYQAELKAWTEHPDRLGKNCRPDSSHSILPPLSLPMLLPPNERDCLLEAATLTSVEKDTVLVWQGARISDLFILCSGLAKATRTLKDGAEQITSIFVPGDTLNAADMAFGVATAALQILSPAVCISIGYAKLDHLMLKHNLLAREVWRQTAAHAAIQQEWTVGLGRQSAQSRLAHFLCELTLRLERSGTDEAMRSRFLLTQRDLADILGLSAVHVNRSLQAMRRAGLIELRSQRLTIKDKEGLYKVGEFDPAYLQRFPFDAPSSSLAAPCGDHGPFKIP